MWSRSRLTGAGKYFAAEIVAIELQENFLVELRNNAAQLGIAHLIETRCADMVSLHDKAGTVDLI
ncbi:MAG: class I SAM-dependent methyltransferase [Candidatus Obscuribacterales bacterium]|nr:class I SAM-dependent methyltransferase [Candidatus Obscuribacterales bacterium]